MEHEMTLLDATAMAPPMSTTPAPILATSSLHAATTPSSSAAELVHDLTTTLDKLLVRLYFCMEDVYGLEDAVVAADLDGRLERLLRVLKRLVRILATTRRDITTNTSTNTNTSSSMRVLNTVVHDVARFLDTLQEAAIAPVTTWHKWWQPGRKYARQLHHLSQRLNQGMADVCLEWWTDPVWAAVIMDQTRTTSTCSSEDDNDDDTSDHQEPFPPTMEALQLLRPTQDDHHDDDHGSVPRPWLRRSPSMASVASTATMDSCSSASTSATEPSTITTTGGETTSCSRPSFYKFLHSKQQPQLQHTNTNTTTIHTTPIPWDWSPRPKSKTSQPPKCRKAMQEYYVQTHYLLAIPQHTPVVKLRIVLAQLQPGDSTPGIQMAQGALHTVGMISDALTSLSLGLWLSDVVVPEPATRTAASRTASVLSHYLLEFVLEDGTIGTLEQCVRDVYLYAGRTPRKHYHGVSTIPTNSLTLADLIRFRHQQRHRAYHLFDNNCKHFVYQALTMPGGLLLPDTTNTNPTNTNTDDLHPRCTDFASFTKLCEETYAERTTFDFYTSGPSSASSSSSSSYRG